MVAQATALIVSSGAEENSDAALVEETLVVHPTLGVELLRMLFVLQHEKLLL